VSEWAPRRRAQPYNHVRHTQLCRDGQEVLHHILAPLFEVCGCVRRQYCAQVAHQFLHGGSHAPAPHDKGERTGERGLGLDMCAPLLSLRRDWARSALHPRSQPILRRSGEQRAPSLSVRRARELTLGMDSRLRSARRLSAVPLRVRGEGAMSKQDSLQINVHPLVVSLRSRPGRERRAWFDLCSLQLTRASGTRARELCGCAFLRLCLAPRADAQACAPCAAHEHCRPLHAINRAVPRPARDWRADGHADGTRRSGASTLEPAE
jgi:hypothetical protein